MAAVNPTVLATPYSLRYFFDFATADTCARTNAELVADCQAGPLQDELTGLVATGGTNEAAFKAIMNNPALRVTVQAGGPIGSATTPLTTAITLQGLGTGNLAGLNFSLVSASTGYGVFLIEYRHSIEF